MRPCLKCQKNFPSTGKGNRICQKCKSGKQPKDATGMGFRRAGKTKGE